MPRKKRASSPFDLMDDDFDEDASSQSSRNGNPPMRNAANARERARMRVLSSAFGRLKTKLPNIPADTKLSKLDTLRLATMYIKQLKTVVEGGTPSSTASLDDRLDGSSILNDNCFLNLNTAAQSMNWPFGFHHQVHNSSTRTTTTSTANNVSHVVSNWCQHDGNNLKQQQRYNTEIYDQHQQQQQQQNDSSNQHNSPSYLATSLLQTTVANGQNHETTWYSETPSPDLSNSPSSGIGYDNVQHHHHHHQQQQQQQQQQRNSLMEHLSHIQLSTPPPSSSSSAATIHSSTDSTFQNHHHQHNSLHHQHSHSQHNNPLPLHHHHHHHHPHLHQHLQHHHMQSSQHLHQAFSNATNFAAASIR